VTLPTNRTLTVIKRSKASEIRQQNTSELIARGESLSHEIARMRLESRSSARGDAGSVRELCKERARIFTILRERQLAFEGMLEERTSSDAKSIPAPEPVNASPLVQLRLERDQFVIKPGHACRIVLELPSPPFFSQKMLFRMGKRRLNARRRHKNKQHYKERELKVRLRATNLAIKPDLTEYRVTQSSKVRLALVPLHGGICTLELFVFSGTTHQLLQVLRWSVTADESSL
jgi:ribosomal protein L29